MFKQATYAVVAAAAAFAAVPASAAHTFQGNINFTFGNCMQVCTGAFASNANSPTFANYFTLTLPNNGAVASQVGEIVVSGQNVDFSSVYLTAFDEIGGMATGPQYNFAINNGVSSSAILTTVGPLSSGTYRLFLDGTSTNSGNGYSGTVTLAAVPEPGTWALFILGFGALGFAMRRRNAQVTSAKATLNFA